MIVYQGMKLENLRKEFNKNNQWIIIFIILIFHPRFNSNKAWIELRLNKKFLDTIPLTFNQSIK